MLTPELKSKVDKLWDAFWSGGVVNATNMAEMKWKNEEELRALKILLNQ